MFTHSCWLCYSNPEISLKRLQIAHDPLSGFMGLHYFSEAVVLSVVIFGGKIKCNYVATEKGFELLAGLIMFYVVYMKFF